MYLGEATIKQERIDRIDLADSLNIMDIIMTSWPKSKLNNDNSEQEILLDSKQALEGAESVQSHNDEEKVQVNAIKILQ